MSDRYDEGYSAVYALTKRLVKLYIARSSSATPAVSDFGHYQDALRKAYNNVKPDQWVNELPGLTAHLATYRETIRRLKAFADARNKPIVFVTQPFVWSDSMSPETRAQIYAGFIGANMTSRDTKWYTPAALEKGLNAYNDTLRETCRSDGLMCVDAAAAMPREAKYFYDDFHFSATGATSTGRAVGDVLSRFTCRN